MAWKALYLGNIETFLFKPLLARLWIAWICRRLEFQFPNKLLLFNSEVSFLKALFQI